MYAAAALALVAAIQPITAFLIQDQYGITDVAEITYVSGIALFSMAIVTLVVQIAVLQVWKLQPAVLLRVGFLVFGVAMIFFAFADSLLMLYLSFAGMGVAFALSTPGLNAAASLAVKPQEQGAVAGLLAAAPSFGMIFGPAFGASGPLPPEILCVHQALGNQPGRFLVDIVAGIG